MAPWLRFELEDGGHVLVDPDPSDAGVTRVGMGDTVAKATVSTFETALVGVRDAAASALSTFRKAADAPAEVEIEFMVQLNGEAGAVIARMTTGGHLRVRALWKKQD